MTLFVSMSSAACFQLVSGATEGKGALRLRFVSASFPFVSCFPTYTVETGNEANLCEIARNMNILEGTRPR
jgi:hypothetical protein